MSLTNVADRAILNQYDNNADFSIIVMHWYLSSGCQGFCLTLKSTCLEKYLSVGACECKVSKNVRELSSAL